MEVNEQATSKENTVGHDTIEVLNPILIGNRHAYIMYPYQCIYTCIYNLCPQQDSVA